MSRKKPRTSDSDRPQLKLVEGTGGKRKRHHGSAPEPGPGEVDMDTMAEQFARLHHELLEGVASAIRKVSRRRRKEEIVVVMFEPYSAAAFEALTERLGLEVSRKKRGGKYTFTVTMVPHAAEEILLPFWRMVQRMLERQLSETAETFIAMAVHGEMPDGPRDEWDLQSLVEQLGELDDGDQPF